jgi:O-antigen biosynthesis protein
MELSPFDKKEYSVWLSERNIEYSTTGYNESVKFSVIMPVHNPNLQYFHEAIQSVLNQKYLNFELIIVDDYSNTKSVEECARSYSDEYEFIRFYRNSKHLNISNTLNFGISKSKGHWICFLDQDDLFHENALLAAFHAISSNEDIEVVYTDEDKIDEDGNRYEPNFKPSINQGLLLSQNYICHLLLVKKNILLDVGLFREGYEGAQDWDLCLRLFDKLQRNSFLHIPDILYHWRAHGDSTAKSITSKREQVSIAAKKSLKGFLERNNHSGEIVQAKGNHWKVDFHLPSPRPAIAILFYGECKQDVDVTCHNILQNTNYDNYTIYLPLDWKVDPSKYKNWDQSRGLKSQSLDDYILLIHDSFIPKNSDWLTEMLKAIQCKNTAFVGPRFFSYENGKNFSSGMVYSDQKIRPLYKNYNCSFPGLHFRIHLSHSFTFLHPYCLLAKSNLVNSMQNISSLSLLRKLYESSTNGMYNTFVPSSELFVKSQVDSFNQFIIFNELENQFLRIGDSAFNTNLKIHNDKIILK